MPLSFTADLHAELLLPDGRLPLERRVTLPGECGEVLEVSLPDGTSHLPVCGTGVGQVTALVVTSDKSVQVCVGDVAQNQSLTLAQGGVLALLDIDVDAAHACALSYTPGDGLVATCLVSVLGTWVQGGGPPPHGPPHGPWFFHTSLFYSSIYCYALLDREPAQIVLASGWRPPPSAFAITGEDNVRGSKLYRNSNFADTGTWRSVIGGVGGGELSSALGMYNGVMCHTWHKKRAPQQWQLYWLHPSESGTCFSENLCVFAAGVENIRALREYDGMGDGNWLYIGAQTPNTAWRFQGTFDAVPGTLESIPTEFGTAGQYVRDFCVMTDAVTHVPACYMALDGGEAHGGAALSRLARDPTLRFAHVVSLPGNYLSPVVVVGETALVAVGSADETSIQIVRLTSANGVVAAETIFRFDGLTGQRPGALAAYNSMLYFGRLSTTTTPILELWRSHDGGTTWSLEVDFQAILGEDHEQGDVLNTDPHTGITVLGTGRGKLYAGTGTHTTPVTEHGVRFYCHPVAEGIV